MTTVKIDRLWNDEIAVRQYDEIRLVLTPGEAESLVGDLESELWPESQGARVVDDAGIIRITASPREVWVEGAGQESVVVAIVLTGGLLEQLTDIVAKRVADAITGE